MTEKLWTITDTACGEYCETLDLDAADLGVPGDPAASIRKRTLRGGPGDGVDLVEIDNGVLSFTVIPTRGMGIWRGSYKGLDIGWKSPVTGPVHPKFVRPTERGGLGWLSGFDECLVRCGLESNGGPATDRVPDNQGNPREMQFTLHGKIANIPAHEVAVKVVPGDPPALCVTGTVDEALLFGPRLRLTTEISTTLGANSWTVKDRVTNLRSVEEEIEVLYHYNFGPPFLEAGARLRVPVAETAPVNDLAARESGEWDRYVEPAPGYVERCYWHRPIGDADGNTLAVLRNAAGDKAIAVRFNVRQLPCFSQWKNCGAESDGYVTGLEPGTDYPNPRLFEREKGRLVTLAPGETREIVTTVEAHDAADAVKKLVEEVAAIQGDTAATVHDKVHPDYSVG